MKSELGKGQPFATMPGRRKDLRPKTGVDVPGSGTYDPKVDPMRRSAPSFSVSKTARDGSLGLYDSTPGCAAYKVND